MSVSTVPEDTTVIVPERSVAVAPASEYESPSSTETGLSPVTVITGAVVSTTLTVLKAWEILPAESLAVYVIWYEPTTFVLTVPDVTKLALPLSSLALAPASV